MKVPNSILVFLAMDIVLMPTTLAFIHSTSPLSFIAQPNRFQPPSPPLLPRSATNVDSSDRPNDVNIDSEQDDNNDGNLLTFTHKSHLPESQYTQVLTSQSLGPISTRLRLYYDEHFQDPRQPDSARFCWDPWYVNVGDGRKNQESDEVGEISSLSSSSTDLVDGEMEATGRQCQYSLKRIQANNFFTEDDFADLVEDLTQLGRSIGLTAITPPWMSLYLNGDMQNLHTDAPHGPLAFVLSLSQPDHFDGGETMLLKPQIMEIWKGFDGSRGLETGNIMRYIPPTPLGRCIAFDPRVPHGVNQVRGTQDPRRGRVVIHGWFSEPEVCWFGPWPEDGLEEMNGILDDALQPLVETLGVGEIGRVCGYLSCRVEVDRYGFVEDVTAVCDTLQADWDDFRGVIGYDEADRPVMEDAVSDVRLTIFEAIKNLNLGSEGDDGRAFVIPFAFE